METQGTGGHSCTVSTSASLSQSSKLRSGEVKVTENWNWPSWNKCVQEPKMSWCPCRGSVNIAKHCQGEQAAKFWEVMGVRGQERQALSHECVVCTWTWIRLSLPHCTSRVMALCEFHLQVPFLKGRADLPSSNGEEQPQDDNQRGAGFPGTQETLIVWVGIHFVSAGLSSPLHCHLLPTFWTAHFY